MQSSALTDAAHRHAHGGAMNSTATVADNESANSNPTNSSAPVNKNKRYRRDKPWDSPSIDHWHIEPVTAENPLPAPLEQTTFAILFPKYREKYLREIWPLVTTFLRQYKIACALDCIEGCMEVSTTKQTFDPYIIIKARDFCKLLSRSIPFSHASKILSDEYICDIIKIKNTIRSKEKFIKRRQRLIGPNGTTLKALECLTDSYIGVMGNTVSVITKSLANCKILRRIVMDCMKNIHPIYAIKTLMIKSKLAKDETLKTENWDRFLPQFEKKKYKKPKKPANADDANKQSKAKFVTPFPPAQTPRKIDIEMETGEYFLSEAERKMNSKLAQKEEKNKETTVKKLKRNAQFLPPEEREESIKAALKKAKISKEDVEKADAAAAEEEEKKSKNAKKDKKRSRSSPDEEEVEDKKSKSEKRHKKSKNH